MSNEDSTKSDRSSAAKAVSMLLVHHELQVSAPVRKVMEKLHYEATRAERRRKSTPTDAARIREYLAQRALGGRAVPTGTEIAEATGIPAKDTHAHLAMMKKRAK
ncbi:MAG: hypothetical protein SGJ09_02215 [Phycisphaerae bacterium]|nr:hypothetical protein [Phycisphaerae bacterium]